MQAPVSHRFPWRPVLSEFIGTALLVLVGLSVVIVMFGTGSPMARHFDSLEFSDFYKMLLPETGRGLFRNGN